MTLVEDTLRGGFTKARPRYLIGDKAYDSDGLDETLKRKWGIEMIAPHKQNRKRPATQDGRKLRRYKHRWSIERLFAWIFCFRRTTVRYEVKLENYLGFVRLACILILLRNL